MDWTVQAGGSKEVLDGLDGRTGLTMTSCDFDFLAAWLAVGGGVQRVRLAYARQCFNFAASLGPLGHLAPLPAPCAPKQRQRTMASRDLTTTFQERRAAANMRRRKAGNGGMKPFGKYSS